MRSPSLAGIPGVLGIGFGLKEVGGFTTARIAWRVYVERKKNRDELHVGELVPAWCDGFPTDVVARSDTTRTAAPTGLAAGIVGAGTRIANSRGVPGTVGCIAFTRAGRQRVVLTNHHVLYGHGGREHEAIWRVSAREPFSLLGRTMRGTIGVVRYEENDYHVDCAIGNIEAPNRLRSFMRLIRGSLQVAPATLAPGDHVMAFSGERRSQGLVVDAAYPDVVEIGGQLQSAPRQVLIRPIGDPSRGGFSVEGDSGMAVLDTRGRIAGLLWGINRRGESVACHAAPAFAALDIHRAQHWRGH